MAAAAQAQAQVLALGAVARAEAPAMQGLSHGCAGAVASSCCVVLLTSTFEAVC